MTTTAVFGASGQTGRRVVDRLLQEGHDVRALSRRGVPRRDGVRDVRLDLGSASTDELHAVLEGVDAVVFAAGGDPLRVDRDGAIRTIEAAERAGVSRYVLITGMGVGRDRPAEYYGGFWDTYFGAKEASERRLRASSVPWTILQPGELLNAPGAGRVTIAPTGSLAIGAITRDDVAGVVVAVLSRDDAVAHSWELLDGGEAISAAVAHAASGPPAPPER